MPPVFHWSWRRRVGRAALPKEHGGSTPEPPRPFLQGTWGSGMLCSHPSLPTSELEVRGRWGSTTCLWCSWKTLGVERQELCLGILELRGSLSGIGAGGALGVWEGMRSPWHVPNPQQIPEPSPGIVTAQPHTAILGWKMGISPVLGLGGASFRLRRRRNSGWQKRQQLQTQDE